MNVVVKCNVILGGLCPTEILLERSVHKPAPLHLVIIVCPGSNNSVKHIMCVVGLESKAVSILVACIMDTVSQTACLSYDRYSTISQSDHLSQTARLALRRHKEHIRTSVYLLGQLRHKTNGQTHSVRITIMHFAEKVLIYLLARTKNSKLAAKSDDVLKHILDKVKTLV